MLKLKLQYFGHLKRRAALLEKTLIWKRLKAKGEGAAGDEVIRDLHQLSGHEKTPGDSGGQSSLVCWSLWRHKESHTTY